MDSLFQLVRRVRGDMGEKDAALVLDADILEWIRDGAERTARMAKCYQRKAVFQASDRIPIYRATDKLLDYCGAIFQAWYRDQRLILANQIHQSDLWNQTSSLPSEYGFDDRDIFILPNPLVTNYTTGTATFTKGSTSVTFAGGASLTTAGAGIGWAIGVGASPSKWYMLQAQVDDTTARLEEPFEETTAAASAYVLTNGAVKVWYAGTPDPVSVISYTTGTVTWTIDSVTVTGAGTAFLANVKPGMWIAKGATSGASIPTVWYKVRSVESDTSLTLYRPYRAATAAGATYVASDPLPLEYDDWVPAYYFAKSCGFARYGERAKEELWLSKFENEVARVQKVARERYAGSEGHTAREYDDADASLWGGGW